MKTALLWLFIINLGVAFGAGVYEARTVIPRWADIPPQEWPNTGLIFWMYVTTVPLTLLTLANLIAGWMDDGARRKWWLGAAIIVLAKRTATFFYFIPTMVGLMTQPLPITEIKATLSQWLTFNHGRHALTLAGWLMALKALSLSRYRL